MFLDNFAESIDNTTIDGENDDISNSIIQNLSDIIDTRNHSMNDNLPFYFGVLDATDKSIFNPIDKEHILKNMKKSISRFEKRLSSVNVSLDTNQRGEAIISISGNYSNNGRTVRLSFKRAIF